ncbi:MAG: YraN family protein [Chthoniobacterales bacterium]|nr:YraN family protein [Chthoniobacterales bacterium]
MNAGIAHSLAAFATRWRDHFGRGPEHLQRGAAGEKLAARYLRRQHGYKVLYRNFRGRSGGEIDLVCRDRDTLVFVEVKTRSREDFGRPVEAVDREKRKRLSRGALAWLRMLDYPDILFRFDVVEVVMAKGTEPRIELIQSAFPLSEPYIY